MVLNRLFKVTENKAKLWLVKYRVMIHNFNS